MCQAKTQKGDDCPWKAMPGLRFCGAHAKKKRKNGATDKDLARIQCEAPSVTKYIQDSGASRDSLLAGVGALTGTGGVVSTSLAEVPVQYVARPTAVPFGSAAPLGSRCGRKVLYCLWGAIMEASCVPSVVPLKLGDIATLGTPRL